MVGSMQFNKPLLKGQFIKRYKRFFVDVTLTPDAADANAGTTVVAHCPNTGSMKTLLNEGVDAYLSKAEDPKRKLQYTLEIMAAKNGTNVGVHTGRPNTIVAEAIQNGEVPELSGYGTLKPEQKYGENSRIDILLSDATKPTCYVEVKNTTLAEGKVALFPDSVTTRGQKHLDELVEMVKQGHRAVMFYLINRNDCTTFAPADGIDPVYGEKLRAAVGNGLEILAYACQVTPQGITLSRKLDVDL